jgi:molybdenum cofactor biosynthesis enzyme MoaA
VNAVTESRKALLRQEQLDIIIGYACNANCPHCIQDIRYQSPIACEDELFDRLRAVLDYYFYEIGGRKVIITGGEPSIFPLKLIGILKTLRDYPTPDFVATYTSGSGLLKRVPGESKTLLTRLAEEGLTDINLSVHHHDHGRNKEFFRLTAMPCADEIAAEVRKVNLNLRLNCNLIREYVGDVEQLVAYLDWARKLGPKDVYFRDLHRIHNRPSSVQFAKKVEKILYTDRQRVDFDRLVTEMIRSPAFTYVGKWGDKHAGQGEQYDFDYEGMPVRVGYIDIGNEDREQPTYFVFAPDGKLYADWNGPDSQHNLPINIQSALEGALP